MIHKQFTVAEMWELEKGHLMSMPTPFDGYVERLARVSSTCLVAAARNRYSVPCEWAGHIVSTRVYPGRIDVATADAVVASHARLPGSGQTSYDWQHYIALVQRKPGALRNGTPFLDLPAPLLRLRQSLLRHPGGDKAMAQVLQDAGYEFQMPRGAFYFFPKAPGGDDVAFVKRLAKELVLAVPGSGFGGPGHFRLAFCVDKSVILRAAGGFKRALNG